MLRRGLLIALVCQAWIVATAGAQTRSFIDSAGRAVVLPDSIERVMAAGPPASVLLYALAPEMMVGWVREPTGRASRPHRTNGGIHEDQRAQRDQGQDRGGGQGRHDGAREDRHRLGRNHGIDHQ
jgi:hypothetical protein